MKYVKTLLASAVAASSIAAPVAMAEVSGSVAIASTYLWRGVDLGSGTPAVSGDLSYSAGGFYTGIWASSGDTGAGTEYDLYAGYGMEFDMFSFDLGVFNYVYPTGAGYVPGDSGTEDTDPFDFTDVILTIGVGPVSFSYYQPVAGFCGGTTSTDCGNDYNYYTLSSGYGAFSFTIGMHDNGDDDATHVNVDYAYNDNLTFTLSQFTDKDDALLVAGDDGDLKFVVSYSIPLM